MFPRASPYLDTVLTVFWQSRQVVSQRNDTNTTFSNESKYVHVYLKNVFYSCYNISVCSVTFLTELS